MKIAICDDAPEDAKLILSYCHACKLPYEITVFSSASELLNAFSSAFYDLVFLDIEMAHPNGYEAGVVLSRLDPRPLIIFTTISLQHAIQGYGIAFRYLCKPVTLSLFQQTFREAVPYLMPKTVILSYNGIRKHVSVNDVVYFESLGHHLVFHFRDNQTFEIKDSMKHMLEQFPHPNFLQVHRSFCINLNYVDSVKPLQITMTDGTDIPLSRKKQEIFQEQFTKLIRGNRI